MEIFWRLLFSHLLADFTFQTDALVRWKRENIYGVLTHSIIFMVISYVVCWNVLAENWSVLGAGLPGWMIVVIITAAHFIIDQHKVGKMMHKNGEDNIFYFLQDQLLHLVFIFLFFKPSQFFQIEPHKWWILGVVFVLLTHFMAIFVFYLKKYFSHAGMPDKEKRYVLMGDRLVVAMPFLIDGWWFPLISAGWVIHTVALKIRGKIDYSWLELIVGYISSIALGVLSRIVYFQ